MINVDYFIKALKILWLRRIIQNSQNCSWYNLSGIDFGKLFTVGPAYSCLTSKNIRNPFWKNILFNWSNFCENLEIDSIQDILQIASSNMVQY